MKRREFIRAGAVGSAAAALASPAIAQDKRQWSMVTAWPKNLPGPGVAAQTLRHRLMSWGQGGYELPLIQLNLHKIAGMQ